MLDKDNTLEYNYKILSQERKKQKISQETAAAQLTLNINQIKSLENNLHNGFITAHFKHLTLKRYAKFLGIDFEKVVPQPVKIITSDVDEETAVKVDIENKNLLQLLILKRIKILIVTGLIVLIFIFSLTVEFDIKTPAPEIISSDLNISQENHVDDDIQALSPLSDNFTQNKQVETISKKKFQEIENTSDISSIEFICTIGSASMDKVWSRVNPEKPATYFHIVSLKKQTICTIDNQGVIKQYNLDEGSKITHRGEAPFKIQLDPSISELYFQGWKVYLKDNDNFIQLTPVAMTTELN
tara:strand:+ start:106 stop:1002 length:897 start_codon:yes stop_codon:yes gene_type:complete